MDNIEHQVATSPPTRDQAREQFEFWTKKLGLIHTFTFDEIYDFMLERRRQNEFRGKIISFEEKIKALPGTLLGDCFPLKHTFADGLYIREITVPRQTLTVTKIHAKCHPFFISKGKVSILTEVGVVQHEAPYSGITKAGTKRIIWHHDEVVLTTVHRTDQTNLEQIEAEVIAKDFGDLEDKMEASRIQNFLDEMKGLQCHS